MGIFGQNWESAYVNTTVPYKVFSRHLIKAEVGVKVGLASVNITLRSKIIFFYFLCLAKQHRRPLVMFRSLRGTTMQQSCTNFLIFLKLLAIPLAQTFHLGVEELVDFNERFEWDWRQGREGYGSFGKSRTL